MTPRDADVPEPSDDQERVLDVIEQNRFLKESILEARFN